MSIRDIIEAATPHTCNGLSSAANALFRDTFDPEHVALMEAEVKRSHDAVLALTGRVERLEAERDALRLRMDEMSRMVDAGLQVSAERVIHSE